MKPFPQLLACAALTIPFASLPASAEPFCYMTTATGQRVNLTHLCSSKNPSASPSAQTGPNSNARMQETSTAKSKAQPNGDYLAHEGRGGHEDKRTGISRDYYYEVWAKSNNRYTLKVWEFDAYPQGTPIATKSFNSVGEATDHFDCVYSRKSLPTCRKS